MLDFEVRIASVSPSATRRGTQARGQLLAGFINAQTATHNIAGSSLSPTKEAGPGYSTGPSLPLLWPPQSATSHQRGQSCTGSHDYVGAFRRRERPSRSG